MPVGGANWNYPTITRLYQTEVLPDIKTRDEDALTLLGGTAPTNIPVGAMKYNRANLNLEEWNGSAFVAKVISLASGGTGSGTAAGARTNLGIGTMGTQNSDNVNISGGSITAGYLGSTGNLQVNGTALILSGAANALRIGGGLQAGPGPVQIIGADGRIPALTTTYIADLSALSSSIPAGAILMFDTSCPAGFTRVVALDNRFPMGGTSYGAIAGAATHTHTVNSHTHGMPGATGNASADHTHTINFLSGVDSIGGTYADFGNQFEASVRGHQHGVTGSTSGQSATHNHAIGGSSGAAAPATDAQNHYPPYVTVVFCRKN